VHQTQSTFVRNDKDQVEQNGQGALCTGTVSLAAFQDGFAFPTSFRQAHSSKALSKPLVLCRREMAPEPWAFT